MNLKQKCRALRKVVMNMEEQASLYMEDIEAFGGGCVSDLAFHSMRRAQRRHLLDVMQRLDLTRTDFNKVLKLWMMYYPDVNNLDYLVLCILDDILETE